MSLVEIEERLKHIHEDPIHGVQHEIIWVLKALTEALQRHEAILLYEHKTLNMDYHRRADEIYRTYKAAVAEEEFQPETSPQDRLDRIKQLGQEATEARAKLDAEFKVEEAS